MKKDWAKAKFSDILGQDSVKKHLKGTLISGRHVLIVGNPGIGKTTLAKNVASENKTAFVRVQGSPDLTVEDLFGDIDPIKAMKFGPTSKEAFVPGKIFKADKGVLFFDELNRAPEKLQNVLLQVLSEKKVTLGGYDLDFDVDFVFIATMNPQDTSTEKLSDVLLDRFDVIYMGYPEDDAVEKEIVLMAGKKIIDFPDSLLSFCVHFVRLLREDDDLERVPSVRASIGLYERAQSHALLSNRKSVVFDDVKDVLISVLAHRIELKPGLRYLKSPEEFISEKFEKVVQKDFKDLKGQGGGL
jgi:MoxR-like ATPase